MRREMKVKKFRVQKNHVFYCFFFEVFKKIEKSKKFFFEIWMQPMGDAARPEPKQNIPHCKKNMRCEWIPFLYFFACCLIAILRRNLIEPRNLIPLKKQARINVALLGATGGGKSALINVMNTAAQSRSRCPRVENVAVDMGFESMVTKNLFKWNLGDSNSVFFRAILSTLSIWCFFDTFWSFFETFDTFSDAFWHSFDSFWDFSRLFLRLFRDFLRVFDTFWYFLTLFATFLPLFRLFFLSVFDTFALFDTF